MANTTNVHPSSVTYGYSPSCLSGGVSFSPLGTGMGPIPSLIFPIY